jgi:hypothetical protein
MNRLITNCEPGQRLRRSPPQAILGAANYITAAICGLTSNQPASACTPTVRSLLGPGN